MQFQVSGYSHVGLVKEVNQDSFMAKVAATPLGDVAIVAVADGMGGLLKGELASATVVRRLSLWFEERLPLLLETMGASVEGFEQAVEGQWNGLVQDLNLEILRFGLSHSMNLGTTITALLAVGARYSILHVGDSRVYEITDSDISQLTEDQTFVKREIDAGRMTPEQASMHPQRNVLLQCVGSSKEVKPQIVHGMLKKDAVYLLCSDGFRHELPNNELQSSLTPKKLNKLEWERPSAQEIAQLCQETAQEGSYKNCPALLEHTVAGALYEQIRLVMNRKERDNITAALLYVKEERR